MYFDRDNLFHVDYNVSTYCCDASYHSFLRFYFQIVQETAGLHAAFRHVSLPELNQIGKTWVVLRTTMTINRYASWKELIHVTTGISKSTGFFGPRIVYALDDKNNELFSAKTVWAVLNIDNHMPQRMNEISDALVPTLKEDDKILSLKERDPKINSSFFKNLPEISSYIPQITYYDTDINNHINNIVYLDWFINALPESYYKSYSPSFVDIAWNHEVHNTNEVIVKVYKIDEFHLGFILFNNTTKEESCISEITFRKK